MGEQEGRGWLGVRRSRAGVGIGRRDGVGDGRAARRRQACGVRFVTEHGGIRPSLLFLHLAEAIVFHECRNSYAVCRGKGEGGGGNVGDEWEFEGERTHMIMVVLRVVIVFLPVRLRFDTACVDRRLHRRQGVHVLYTGDYSMESDRHLMAAEMPSTSPDVLIVEATYGVQVVWTLVRRGNRQLCPRRDRSVGTALTSHSL